MYVLCIAILYYLSACLAATDIINIHEQNSHIVKLVWCWTDFRPAEIFCHCSLGLGGEKCLFGFILETNLDKETKYW